ncbi:hypothetical protein ACO0SA_002457 [Hanseniaspora valbyensis]
MSNNDLLFDKDLDKEYNNSDSGSDSSIGIKNFGQDDSELSEGELNKSSGDENDDDAEQEDKLLETIQLKLAQRKKISNGSSQVMFVDEFQSDSDIENEADIDDENMNDNKLKILKDQRSVKKNGKYYNKPPRFTFSSTKMNQKIEESPENIKNIAIIGPFRSGKTSLVSNMIVKKHRKHFQRQKYDYLNLKKYMDNSLITKYRKTTSRLNMGNFLHNEDTVMNIIDTPGHSDFWNETQIALEMADFVYIIIDCVEGVTDSVIKLYEVARLKMGLNVGFILNKIDRLVLELKLDEIHFFLKIQDIVNDINKLDYNENIFSPERGNILFSSSKYHFIFSIKQFLASVNESYRKNNEMLDYITKRSWGNVVFEDNKFEYCPNWNRLNKVPSFVTFIAEPLYEIFKNGLVLKTQDLKKWVELNFGYLLKSSSDDEEYTAQLIKLFESIFENDNKDTTVSMINQCFVENTINSIAQSPTPEQNFNLSCIEKKGLSHLSKLIRVFKVIDYNNQLWSLCKIYKGNISIGDDLYFEGKKLLTVSEIAVMGGRFVKNIQKAFSNQIVLLRGINTVSPDDLVGMGTLYSKEDFELANKFAFTKIDFVNEPVMKVVLQPKQLKHLTLLNKGLKLISKIYPDIRISVDTSREYILYGCGELQIDTILFELRYFYICYFDRNITDFIEIKSTGNVITSFKEGCFEESFASIPVTSKNYSLSIVATKINDDLSEVICKNQFFPERLFKEKKLVDLSAILRNDFKWESEAARNIIAISGTNFFINDILPDDLDTQLFQELKPYLIKGFEKVVSEGPLAEEPLHNVIFKLMTLDKLDETSSTPLEVLPLSTKAFKIALLSAKPILLEPYYSFSIITKFDYERNVKSVLKRRRGSQIFNIKEISGSPLIQVTGIIPTIDSIGLNVDLQMVTQGSTICQFYSMHKRWYKVPGNVLDQEVQLSKLEPSEGDALSRDFLMKTRKRKGLESENENSLNDNGPSLKEYLDLELYLQLKELKMV